MFVEHFNPKNDNLKWEPELASYFVRGLTTNGYPNYRWEHDFVIRQSVSGKKPHRVLDAGGGIGVLQVLLAKAGNEVSNADRDPHIVQKVRAINRKFGVKIQAFSTDLSALPFKNNAFDGIVSVSSLEHNRPEGLKASIVEMSRVLRPGGYMALTLPVAANNPETWDPRVYALWRWCPEKLRQAFDEPFLTRLPTFSLPKPQALKKAQAYGPRGIYPVGIYLRKRGW